jgi:hypothetical protein
MECAEWNGMRGMEWNGMEWNGMEWNAILERIEIVFLRNYKEKQVST